MWTTSAGWSLYRPSERARGAAFERRAPTGTARAGKTELEEADPLELILSGPHLFEAWIVCQGPYRVQESPVQIVGTKALSHERHLKTDAHPSKRFGRTRESILDTRLVERGRPEASPAR